MGAAKAADFLDLSPTTLRDYSDRGIIPCYRIGKHRKYSLEKIREKLEKEQRDSGLLIRSAGRSDSSQLTGNLGVGAGDDLADREGFFRGRWSEASRKEEFFRVSFHEGFFRALRNTDRKAHALSSR